MLCCDVVFVSVVFVFVVMLCDVKADRKDRKREEMQHSWLGMLSYQASWSDYWTWAQIVGLKSITNHPLFH